MATSIVARVEYKQTTLPQGRAQDLVLDFFFAEEGDEVNIRVFAFYIY